MSTITVTYITDRGEEIVLDLPAKNEVCHDCDGEGYVLCEGMRGYAYSAEELYESFDAEERAEYFRPGGRYDVVCPTCKGKNVVKVVDEDNIPASLKDQYGEYLVYEEAMAYLDACDRATVAAELRMGC